MYNATLTFLSYIPYVKLCRLEASSTGVDLYPSSLDNSNGSFAGKTPSSDSSPTVEAPRPLDLSWSAAKAPYSIQV